MRHFPYRLLPTIVVLLAVFAAAPSVGAQVQLSEAPSSPDNVDPEPIAERVHHGFRMGYSYITPTEGTELATPHLMVLGYEIVQRLTGGDWLNIITVQNVMVAGLNQSIVVPSANFLVGFELFHHGELGVGANFSLGDPNNNWVHMIVAAGFTFDSGAFDVPLHVSYVPDVDGANRFAITTGVNW